MTQFTDSATLERMIGLMGLQRRQGRATTATQVTQDEVRAVELEINEAGAEYWMEEAANWVAAAEGQDALDPPRLESGASRSR